MHINDIIEDKAADNGQFAIAYALLELAKATDIAARALDRMGMNQLNPRGAPGTLEAIAMQLREGLNININNEDL